MNALNAVREFSTQTLCGGLKRSLRRIATNPPIETAQRGEKGQRYVDTSVTMPDGDATLQRAFLLNREVQQRADFVTRRTSCIGNPSDPRAINGASAVFPERDAIDSCC